MALQITGKNIELTEAIKSYIEEKTATFFHAVENIIQIDVEVDKNKHHNKGEDVFHVRINVEVPHQLMHVEEERGDLYAAIDCARDTMDRELTQYKEKFHSKKQREWNERREMKSAHPEPESEQ